MDLWNDFAATFPIIILFESGRYLVIAGLVSLLIQGFWRAHFAARKIQARTATPSDLRREIFCSLRTTLVFAMVGYGMHLSYMAGWLDIYHDFSERGLGYFLLSLSAMFVAHDTYFYWTHRTIHHPRLFRAFHWTHHRSRTPTPWTAYSFDVPEAVVMALFVPAWTFFVPMHDLALFIFVTLQLLRNVTGHSSVDMVAWPDRLKPGLRWWNTAIHHDLHHQFGRGNYGLYFTWWDRLMGTERADTFTLAETLHHGHHGHHGHHEHPPIHISDRKRTQGKT